MTASSSANNSDEVRDAVFSAVGTWLSQVIRHAENAAVDPRELYDTQRKNVANNIAKLASAVGVSATVKPRTVPGERKFSLQRAARRELEPVPPDARSLLIETSALNAIITLAEKAKCSTYPHYSSQIRKQIKEIGELFAIDVIIDDSKFDSQTRPLTGAELKELGLARLSRTSRRSLRKSR